MTDRRRPRRRGGRGRARPQQDGQPAPRDGQPSPQPRQFRDLRGVPGPQRANDSGDRLARPERRPARRPGMRPPERDARRAPQDRRGDDGRQREPRRDAPSRPREVPVPQDERSIELGALFKEAQTALRDAKKTLEKRKAEFNDEPPWLLDQYEEAERRFAEIATQWHDHLATTGRKVVRT